MSPHPAIGAHDEQWTHHFTTTFMAETTTVGNSFWKEVACFFPVAEHSVLLSLQLDVRITLWDSLSSLAHPPVPAASMRGGSQAAWPLPWFSLAHVTLLSVRFVLFSVTLPVLSELNQFRSWPNKTAGAMAGAGGGAGDHQPFETAATDELACHATVLWGALRLRFMCMTLHIGYLFSPLRMFDAWKGKLVLKYDLSPKFKPLKGCVFDWLPEIQGWENYHLLSIAMLSKHSASLAFFFWCYHVMCTAVRPESKRPTLCAASLWGSIRLFRTGTAPRGALCTEMQVQGTRKRESRLKTKTNVREK